MKLYGAYQFAFGTQIGAFFYGGSGTPISTYVVGQDQNAPIVDGRGDMGRTPMLTRTDLLALARAVAGATASGCGFELNVPEPLQPEDARRTSSTT